MTQAETLNTQARERYRKAETHWIRRLYLRWICPRLHDELSRQRAKLLYRVWGYWPLLFVRELHLVDRLRLLFCFLRVDWNVPHGHRPAEIVAVVRALSDRPARPGEVMVEAGCWKGGSSAKFSLLCALLGYRLRIYDSFQGVEKLDPTEQAKEWDYAGQYSSPKHVLEENLRRYGVPEVCSVHEGWFSESLARRHVSQPVRLVFIDCDLAKGTMEVLRGTVPSLVQDGWIFSQDYHIEPVRQLLLDPETWDSLSKEPAAVAPLGTSLASFRFVYSLGNP